MKVFGQGKGAMCLSVAAGPGMATIRRVSILGDETHRLPSEATDPRQDRVVILTLAIAVQLEDVSEHALRHGPAARAIRMPRQLDRFPRPSDARAPVRRRQ